MAAKLVYADVAAIAGKAMELYRNEEIDAVYLIYNEFKSVAAQTLLTSKVLPIQLPQQASPVDYIFEQSPVAMLDALLPRYVETEFYRALAESTA
jgi:F-type H+-transporting ATPase subunit gamma